MGGEAGGGKRVRNVHVAVVHGERRINLVAVAESRSALTARLAGYVRANAGLQLYPREARLVVDLLDRGAADGAVRFYFERVGRRWDREWLHTEVIEAEPSAGRSISIPAERLWLSRGAAAG